MADHIYFKKFTNTKKDYYKEDKIMCGFIVGGAYVACIVGPIALGVIKCFC